jgi:hypothetical protein
LAVDLSVLLRLTASDFVIKEAVNGRRADNTMVKCKSTNNDQQYIKQRVRIQQHEPRKKTEVNACVPDG